MQEDLAESGRKFFAVFMANPAPMFIATCGEGRIEHANRAFGALVGVDASTLAGTPVSDLDIWDDEARRLLGPAMSVQPTRDVELSVVSPSGKQRDLVLCTEPLPGFGGENLCFGVITDLTAYRVLERQFQQAQKMEAIGQLAGGVAHDFNNLLTVIFGFAELVALRDDLPAGAGEDIEQILQAASSARSVTGQLLAFSRRSMIEPRVKDINAKISEMATMLRRLLGPDIELRMDLAPDIGPVLVDPGQIDQIIMNLAVNARDAMPAGGTLTIQTARAHLDDAWAALHPEGRPGTYTMISVTDTGIGMDKEVRSQIFEPFFTTKDRGRGTGLGLSMVYGAVKQSGGSIWVYSELGLGTTMRIYLPVARGPLAEPEGPRGTITGGTETVLVVEDQEEVRQLVREVLVRHGYRVRTCASARETLRFLASNDMKVDLLLTDIVMPQMDGRHLAYLCQSQYPGLKVLYMSGYTTHSVATEGISERGLAFIQKPFTAKDILAKVRQVLDARVHG
jgi:two-component system, cell cycle sensor histidine kinase and response regulator CckA